MDPSDRPSMEEVVARLKDLTDQAENVGERGEGSSAGESSSAGDSSSAPFSFKRMLDEYCDAFQ